MPVVARVHVPPASVERKTPSPKLPAYSVPSGAAASDRKLLSREGMPPVRAVQVLELLVSTDAIEPPSDIPAKSVVPLGMSAITARFCGSPALKLLQVAPV